MKTLQYLLLIPLFCFFSKISAQDTGSIEGKVTDAMTGEPLIGTNIQIAGTLTGTTTDLDGYYKLDGLAAGSYVIKTSFISYQSSEIQVNVVAGQVSTQDFQLAADLLGLDQVVVTGVINQKSALESSIALTSVKPQFIKELGAQTTAEIFKTIPGIRSESSGGEGNANIAVRGVPVASGGAKFLQLHEDGLPVLQFGDISFGNADIFLRADLSIARIEAIKGGSASTFASNSPAGIINFISKTGAVEGGTVSSTVGLDYKSLRTDFEYGSPIGENLKFHIGGFFRLGEGPRNPGYNANYGGQLKANITKDFKQGYARIYFKYLNDRTISYMPMPIRATGAASNPTYESVPGYDIMNSTMQSPHFLHVVGVDGNGNARTSNIADGMHPEVTALGSEFSFDLGDGWRVKNKARMAFTKGTFNSPFPAQIGLADDIATDIAGTGYVLSYANGANAGTALSGSEVQNLNGNGLLMRVHNFDTEMNNLNNFTNDVFLTKDFGKVKVTAGYYKAYQKIAMTWLWQTYLTDVSSENGPRLVDITSQDSSFYSQNGLIAHGVPFWGNCCTRGYDMMYTTDAPYANVEVELTPDINIDASIRYDFGDASGYYLNNYSVPFNVDKDTILEPFEQEVTVLDNANPLPVDYDYSYLSYSVGVNYKIENDMAVYARFSNGGRANADRLLYTSFLTSEGKTIEGLNADEISQAELGFKYKSGNLGVIATGFYTSISEQNEEFGRAINKDFNSYGAELEAVANISGINIAAGATYTKAKIKKSINSDEVGNTPRRVPDLMYSLSPSYSFFDNNASLGFSLIGTTKVYAQDDNAVVIPGYMYINVFLGYTITEGLNIRFNTNNVLNSLGITEMEGDPFTDNAVNYLRARPITGRATTATLTYTF